MTPDQAFTAPLEFMSLTELREAYAHCDGEIRRCTDWGVRMDQLEQRRAKIESFILAREPKHFRQNGSAL